MNFNLKKEIIIFLAIFIIAGFSVYLLLNSGAYLNIFRYYYENKPILDLKNLSGKQAVGSDKNYYLYIPKIGVSVPIVLPKNDSDKSVLTALEEGAALYPGSQLPGEIGRSVILGHSSQITLYHGKFAYVFALLNKLQTGDEFYVVSENKKLVYKVFANDTLTPEKTNEILSQPPENKSEVALVTCWPIGFSSKRTLIQAKLDRVEKIK